MSILHLWIEELITNILAVQVNCAQDCQDDRHGQSPSCMSDLPKEFFIHVGRSR